MSAGLPRHELESVGDVEAVDLFTAPGKSQRYTDVQRTWWGGARNMCGQMWRSSTDAEMDLVLPPVCESNKMVHGVVGALGETNGTRAQIGARRYGIQRLTYHGKQILRYSSLVSVNAKMGTRERCQKSAAMIHCRRCQFSANISHQTAGEDDAQHSSLIWSNFHLGRQGARLVLERACLTDGKERAVLAEGTLREGNKFDKTCACQVARFRNW